MNSLTNALMTLVNKTFVLISFKTKKIFVLRLNYVKDPLIYLIVTN